jgi:hypothetical protein
MTSFAGAWKRRGGGPKYFCKKKFLQAVIRPQETPKGLDMLYVCPRRGVLPLRTREFVETVHRCVDRKGQGPVRGKERQGTS